MPTLTLLTTAHIQSYLFERTHRLSESIGASAIVKGLFEHWNHHTGKLFIGGGNAAIEFPDSDTAKKELFAWSRDQLEQAPGLRIVAAHESFSEGGLADAFRRAQHQLEERSASPPYGSSLGALPIVRTCASTSLAAERWDGSREQWVSREALEKRLKQPTGDESIKKLEDFEDSQIAMIHADGNGIGAEMDEVLERCQSQSDAFFRAQIREFAAALTWLADETWEALKSDVNSLAGKYSKFAPGLRLPLRPVVGAGDDVTWITLGRLGLPLAARYLSHYERLSPQAIQRYQGTRSKLTASAGVLIMPAKYPFARGYRLVEALTNNAKRRRREEGGEGSWLDFHLLLGSAAGSLEDLRRGYKIGNLNLLRRPYRLDDEWPKFVQRWKRFQLQQDWPRSAAKDLLEALYQGEEATRAAEERNKVRNRRLDSPAWADNRTPYFDPLEMLDCYLEIDWETHDITTPEAAHV